MPGRKHTPILEAVKARDIDAALDALSVHFDETKEPVVTAGPLVIYSSQLERRETIENRSLGTDRSWVF